MSADDLGPDRGDDCGNRRNQWLDRRRSELVWGFLTRMGKFKPVGLAQWCLSQAGADCRGVHGCFCCQGNRCFDSLADQQGGEHGHTRNRKPYRPNHYSNPATHECTGSSGVIRAVRGQDESCLWIRKPLLLFFATQQPGARAAGPSGRPGILCVTAANPASAIVP